MSVLRHGGRRASRAVLVPVVVGALAMFGDISGASAQVDPDALGGATDPDARFDDFDDFGEGQDDARGHNTQFLHEESPNFRVGDTRGAQPP